MKRISVCFFIIISALTGTINLAIADNEAMQLTMTVEEVIETVDAQGNRSTQQIPADKVVPGDRLVYITRYSYHNDESAQNVVITNVIPAEVTYLPDSATGSPDITFSVDGGDHFDIADKLSITTDEGVRPARPEDYTHIRWLIPQLTDGQQGSVSYHSTLNEE